MRNRQIAILIDGGFFLKRLPNILSNQRKLSAKRIANLTRILARRHIMNLTRCPKDQWQQHIYRIFFYDAVPYEGKGHHPLKNQQIDFAQSDTARFRNELFQYLRKQRNTALQLGKVIIDTDWAPDSRKIKKILKTRDFLTSLTIQDENHNPHLLLNTQQLAEFDDLKAKWADISDDEVKLGFRQKGVDMRIGLDISTITLKKLADTIVLVAGDSDFVPAAKLARREGVEFILDPLWQTVHDDLYEHIDVLQSGIKKYNRQQNNAD